MKKCTKCGIQKPLSEFYKNKSKPSGFSSYCKFCGRANTKKWNAEHPDYQKKYHFKSKYGITLEDRSVLLKLQQNKCAICKIKIEQTDKYHVDHCHITNKVRGILCANCNILLGHAKDSTTTLKSALQYLEKYNLKK
jgi:hypothetical protein